MTDPTSLSSVRGTSSSSGRKSDEEEEDEDSDEGKISDNVCVTCNKVVDNLNEHIRSLHKHIRDKCAGCGKTFKGGDSYLRRHWKLCRGQPKCKPCGVPLCSPADIASHSKCRGRRGRRHPLPCQI